MGVNKDSDLDVDTRFITMLRDKNFKWLILLGFIVAVLRVSFSQAEDMGIFLTVSGMVAHGYHLYSQIFDIKDPLFFYASAISMKIFGIRGPFVLDACLVILSAPIAYVLGILFRVRKWIAFTAAIFFLLSLTGTYYQSFRTQIAAIDLVLILAITCLLNKWYLSGFIFLLLLGFKLPFGIFVVLPIILILRSQNRNRNIIRFTLSFIASAACLALLMQLRGELLPYIRMNIENFTYQSGYQAIVGQTPGFVGHLIIWNQNSANVMYFVFGGIITFVLVRKTENNRNLRLATIAVCTCVAIFLAETAMWSHHLQILALTVPFFSFCILEEITDRIQPTLVRKRLPNLTRRTSLNPGVLVVILIALLMHTGFMMPSQSTMSINKWIDPQWSTPAEIAMLNTINIPAGSSHTFARVGANDDSGFGAFLPREWKFRCSRVLIGGIESRETIDNLDNCLKSQVNFILVSPKFSGESNRAGTYPYYFNNTELILSNYFKCRDVLQNGFRLCSRNVFLK